MKTVTQNITVEGMKGGLDSFISGITEKGLELAEGSKFVQRNLPETYKGIKTARKMYVEYNNKLAEGKSREVRGPAAKAIGKVMDGLGEDIKSTLSSLMSKFKKPKVPSPVVSRVGREI